MDKKLEELVRELGEALYQQGNVELGNQWKKITLDARYDHTGGVLGKIRAVTDRGETVSVKSDDIINLLLISLDDCRDSVGLEWYGLLMTVTSSMECMMDFNYDPNCEQDTTFLEE